VASSGAQYWDGYFRGLRETAEDLDWRGVWTHPFLPRLRAAGAKNVLELGCGTGNDAGWLALEGYTVTAVDVSAEAVSQARARYGRTVAFFVADLTAPLPFELASFDAVMSNVALHMFPDEVTRSVFDAIRDTLRPRGLFLFHVNSLEDRHLRARRIRVAREIEDNYVLEESGQAVRFFSEAYLSELMTGWSNVELERVEATHRRTGEPKRVWRGIARK
jgi:SAM-dependent methyltransferase